MGIRRRDWEQLQPTVCGWGIYDLYSNIKSIDALIKTNNGVELKAVPVSEYYQDWARLITRCFDTNFKELNPTYEDCTMNEGWKYFSNFIKWVNRQPNRDWINCHLDKDFLIENKKKHYSPTTCVYISGRINHFILDSSKVRGELMIGVSDVSSTSKINPYRARCSNPFTNTLEHLGMFQTELEAHKAWQAKKHAHGIKLSKLESDQRVAHELRTRYAPDKDWTKA